MDRSEEGVRLLRRIRLVLVGLIVGLFLSGVTAFPLPKEARLLADALAGSGSAPAALVAWIARVREGLDVAEARYPFLLYGTDWLAFAHLVIAAAFVGPLRDPVRNVWVVQWGVFSCAATIPLALICGPLRGIPFFWQLVDCSFGIVAIGPLLLCLHWIRRLESNGTSSATLSST